MSIPWVKHLSVILMTLMLVACSDPTPVPSDKTQYVGLWVASDRYISIFSNGRLEYKEKLKWGFHNRIQGNFEFAGNQIRSIMFSSFTIDVKPSQNNGQWQMVLDGIPYRKVGPPITYGRSNIWPEGVE